MTLKAADDEWGRNNILMSVQNTKHGSPVPALWDAQWSHSNTSRGEEEK